MSTAPEMPVSSASNAEALPVSVTVAVINYNGQHVLEPTLRALRDLSYLNFKTLVMDDGSNDGSDAWTEANYPEFRLVRMGSNAGKPGIVRNRALELADTPYVMLLDHDVVLLPGCLEALVETIQSKPQVLCCTPRLLNSAARDHIYIDDGGLHFLGISARPTRGVPAALRPPGDPVPSLAGGNLLIDRQAALALGGFDTGYMFGWGEDAELVMRGRLSGGACLHVQKATAVHLERPHGKGRAEAQFYNRARLILTQYHARTLLLLAPALLVMEVMLLTASLLMGVTDRYWRAWWRVWRDRGKIARNRAAVQAARRVSDADLLEATPIALAGMASGSRAARVASRLVNVVSRSYWWAVRPCLWSPSEVSPEQAPSPDTARRSSASATR